MTKKPYQEGGGGGGGGVELVFSKIFFCTTTINLEFKYNNNKLKR